MLDYTSHKCTTLVAPVNFSPSLSEIGCILLDKKGYYWLGTRNGLFRFPQSSLRETRDDDFIISQLEVYRHQTNNPSSIPGDYVISLMEDTKGNIWVGTYGNGLAKAVFNSAGELVFDTWSEANGLSNNTVYGIQEDSHNRIWISTDFGLSMLNTTNNVIQNFYKQDGLLNNQFYWSASYKSNDGILYFGGIEGLNYFNPDNFNDYDYNPIPRITKFRIHNKEVIPGTILHNKMVISKPVYDVDTILLSYKDNNISFDFSSFDYFLPEKSKYAYKMTGMEKEWDTVPAQRRFAGYKPLKGGTYTFMLKASNCDGIWNDQPTKITIIITPPFWKTVWFRILLYLFVALLTYLLIRLQMRRIIAQKKLLEEKVKQRTKKIEDQKVILEKQAAELTENYHQLEYRQKQIELQKEELETKNEEISKQRDELILLNEKVYEINQVQLRFFTNISHEFQTPLTLIISPLERLINKLKADEETLNLLSIIDRNAHRLLMLIRQLLEIRKIETGNQVLQVELTETQPFLDDIYHSFVELAQKNRIDYTCDFQVAQSAWIDKEKLENVIYNLVSNAFKFTPLAIQSVCLPKPKKPTMAICCAFRYPIPAKGLHRINGEIVRPVFTGYRFEKTQKGRGRDRIVAG
jgi:signal transduction histidine kinase